MLKDWRLLSLGAAGRTAVLKLFAPSSLRSGARGATARPADPGALSAGVRDPRAVRPGHGASTSTSRASLRAHRRGARWLERREETDATGHAAAILRDLDLAVDDEQVGALVDLMFL